MSNSTFAQAAALSLDYFEEVTLPEVYLERFQRNGNAQAFAEACTGFFKAAFEPCLFVNLSDKRTPESRQRVMTCFRKDCSRRSRKIRKNIRAAGSYI
jgi:hypothetical protein